MFAVPGIVILILLVNIRPLEFVPALKGVPALQLALLLTLFGFVIDVRIWRSRLVAAPQLVPVLLLFAWCLVGVALRSPSDLPRTGLVVGISLLMFLLIAHGVQTFRALHWVTGTLLAITLFLSTVGVHQRLAPLGCFAIDEGSLDGAGVYDGRGCTTRKDCEEGATEPGAEYLCEHVGLFGTSSIGGGRVRYRGNLNDPNELALACCVGLPFAFVLVERRRTLGRIAFLVATLIVVATCTVYTQSRGGQLVFIAVIGAYLVRRFGKWSIPLGALVALPMLALGGRSGDEAEGSSMERLEAWAEGLTMFRSHPILGVGQGQFTDYHYLTAHNSYILSTAELGFVGMVLWSSILYLSFKTAVQVLREVDVEHALARTWAMALLASLCGMATGILFLSFSYHPVLWIYLGVAGAFATAIEHHAPGFRVRFGWRDLGLVAGIDAVLIAALMLYTRAKGA